MKSRIAVVSIYFFNLYFFSSWLLQITPNQTVADNLLTFINLLVFVLFVIIWRKSLLDQARFFIEHKWRNLVIVLVGFIIYTILNSWVQSFFSGDTQNQKNVVEMVANTAMPLSLILEIALLGPVIEELVFRYSLMWVEQSKWKTLGSLLISSLLFGLIHLYPGEPVINTIPYLISGLLLGVIYIKTKNIYVSIFIHIMNNALFFIGV